MAETSSGSDGAPGEPGRPGQGREGVRYGAATFFKELVRAPGAIFAEGRDDGGAPVLMQVVPLRAADGDDARAHREDYVHMVARATALLAADGDPPVLDHGVVDRAPGPELYWVLPWIDGAQRLGHAAAHLESSEHLEDIASALLQRIQARHEAGRLDPLLSMQVTLLEPGSGAGVIGLPIHLPPGWLDGELPTPPWAPEEVERGEPTRAGDLWRLGRALTDLGARLERAPAGLVKVIERLCADDPRARFDSAEAALIELEGLQNTLAGEPQDFAASLGDAPRSPELRSGDFPPLPVAARGKRDEQPTVPSQDLHPPAAGEAAELGAQAAADLVGEELIGGPTVAMESEPAMGPDGPDTAPDRAAPDDEEQDLEDSLELDTSPQFPSPIAAERLQGNLPAKELATVRLPFPEELKRQAEQELEAEAPKMRSVPQGRVTHVATPGDIPEGETLLEVRRPPPIAASATVVDDGYRGVEDPSDMTIRDVPRQEIDAQGDEFPTMDEVGGGRANRNAWDRAKRDLPFDPTRNRPHGGQPLPPKTAPLGPRGTLVGARLINDPTGLRQMQELPGMLPPPDVGRGAPLSHAENVSSDLAPGSEARASDDLFEALPGPAPAASPFGGSPPPVAPAAPVALPPAPPSGPPAALVPTAPAPSTSSPGEQRAPAIPRPGPAGNPNAPLIGGPPPEPAPSGGRLPVLLGAIGFFLAGGLAAVAIPYLLPSQTIAPLEERAPEAPAARTYAITPANEVLLQASPASAVVVSEVDGRNLGRTPLRFLVPPGLDTAILVAARGHEPQRVALPVRGRIRTDLVPLSDATPCEIGVEVPSRTALEAVAADVTGKDERYSVPGAALMRAKVGQGAWLVRCPRLGGVDPAVLPPRTAATTAELWVVGPSNATVFIDGEEVGSTPMRAKVKTGFREVAVEKLSSGAGRTRRWVPVFGNTKIRMPRPRGN